jgi:hypothetical protein
MGTLVTARTQSRYEGGFCNGAREGFGKFVSESCVYEGQWLCDKMHGSGMILYADGSEYIGHFAKGKKDGPGHL